jgi:uncharacterized membrane protein
VQEAPASAAAAVTPARPPLARMGIALLALLGLFVSAYLALYNLGATPTLQCGIGGCERVQASEYAWFLGIPVALWGVGGYATILAVSILGVQPGRTGSRPIGWALTGLAGIALLFSAYLTWLEAVVIEAWCQWCVVSAILVVLIFLLALADLYRLRRSTPFPTTT